MLYIDNIYRSLIIYIFYGMIGMIYILFIMKDKLKFDSSMQILMPLFFVAIVKICKYIAKRRIQKVAPKVI